MQREGWEKDYCNVGKQEDCFYRNIWEWVWVCGVCEVMSKLELGLSCFYIKIIVCQWVLGKKFDLLVQGENMEVRFFLGI